jgi:hypothetical protein
LKAAGIDRLPACRRARPEWLITIAPLSGKTRQRHADDDSYLHK